MMDFILYLVYPVHYSIFILFFSKKSLDKNYKHFTPVKVIFTELNLMIIEGSCG